MDWKRAIERNSEALEDILATLYALLETASGAARISRPLYRALLRVLHPAEAAARRLIVIAARGLAVELSPTRPRPGGLTGRSNGRGLTFRLFDRRKAYRFEASPSGPRLLPRIHVFGSDPRVAARWQAAELPAAPPPDDGLIDAQRVTRRIEALRLALADLPRQARRLARMRAKRRTDPLLKFKSPLRPGPPPGYRRVPVHDIDFVLAECHGLARDALAADTS